jgi:hypothetical protein
MPAAEEGPLAGAVPAAGRLAGRLAATGGGSGGAGGGGTAGRRAPLRRAPAGGKAQAVVAAPPPPDSAPRSPQQQHDRESLAVGMLVEGRARAFIDFFELTQSAADGGGVAGPGPGSEQEQTPTPPGQGDAGAATAVAPDGLLLLHEQLVAADAAAKAGDARGAFAALRELGRHFTARLQLERAAEFYGKCQQVGGGAPRGRRG